MYKSTISKNIFWLFQNTFSILVWGLFNVFLFNISSTEVIGNSWKSVTCKELFSCLHSSVSAVSGGSFHTSVPGQAVSGQSRVQALQPKPGLLKLGRLGAGCWEDVLRAVQTGLGGWGSAHLLLVVHMQTLSRRSISLCNRKIWKAKTSAHKIKSFTDVLKGKHLQFP